MTPETNLGGRVAAFFDLDGTLVPDPSLEWQFFSELRRNRRIPFVNYFHWSIEALRLLPKGLVAIQHNNKRYLTGVNRDLVFRHMGSISFFEEGITRVVWHARQGHEIVLVSGTLEVLALLAAAALECELEARSTQLAVSVSATALAEACGRWTGYLGSEVIYGQQKAKSVEMFSEQQQLDLRLCHAYGNSLLDRHLLCAVGHAHAVNPGRELAALANRRNWPIWHWHLEKQIASGENTNLAQEIHQIEGPA
ncbi:MAG TPA: haloacid dehalogenase-like hydrolase [Candidatus Acidoferrum sp.]|nr:haloacid dehalogenase-like hydrolase [Candidatus Acidoferrum sp.]